MAVKRFSIPHALLMGDTETPPMKRWEKGLHSLPLNVGRPKIMAKGTLTPQGKIMQLLPSILLNAWVLDTTML